jgi:hypothetical protein
VTLVQPVQTFSVAPPSLQVENAGLLFCPGRVTSNDNLESSVVLIQMRVEESRDKQMEDVTIRRAVPGDAELLAELGAKIVSRYFRRIQYGGGHGRVPVWQFQYCYSGGEIAEPDSYFLIATIGDEPAVMRG